MPATTKMQWYSFTTSTNMAQCSWYSD